MLPEVFGESSETDRGEEVDGETGVGRVIAGEDAFECGLQGGVACTGHELGHAHVLGELLEEDLDEDPGRAGGLILVEVDDGEDLPRVGVGEEEVREELGHVPELPDLQAVNGFVGRRENVLEGLDVDVIDLAELKPRVVSNS